MPDLDAFSFDEGRFVCPVGSVASAVCWGDCSSCPEFLFPDSDD